LHVRSLAAKWFRCILERKMWSRDNLCLCQFMGENPRIRHLTRGQWLIQQKLAGAAFHNPSLAFHLKVWNCCADSSLSLSCLRYVLVLISFWHYNDSWEVNSCCLIDVSAVIFCATVYTSNFYLMHSRDVKSSRPVWPRGQIFRPRSRCVWPRPHGLWPRPHRSWPRGLVNEQRNVLLKLCITSWLIKLLSGNLYTFISGCLLKS